MKLKWTRDLRIKKRIYWNNDGDEYKVVSDAALTSWILKSANSYGCKIKSIESEPWETMRISIYSSRIAYQGFTTALIDTFGNRIESIDY